MKRQIKEKEEEEHRRLIEKKAKLAAEKENSRRVKRDKLLTQIHSMPGCSDVERQQMQEVADGALGQPRDDLIELENVQRPVSSHPHRQADEALRSSSQESFLRQRQMAALHAKESRPTRKFSNGSSLEYRNIVARLELAIDNPGMDARMKLLELSHWF